LGEEKKESVRCFWMVARRGDPAELADLIAACGPGVSRCTSANSLPCAAWLVAGAWRQRARAEHEGSLVQTKQVSGWRREPMWPRRRSVLLPIRLAERLLSQTPSVSGHCIVSRTINYTAQSLTPTLWPISVKTNIITVRESGQVPLSK